MTENANDPVEDGTAAEERENSPRQGNSPVGELPGATADDQGNVHYQHPLLNKAVYLSADHWRELTVESAIDPALVLARGYMTVEEMSRKFLKEQGISPQALGPEHFPGLLLILFEVDGPPPTPVEAGHAGRRQAQVHLPDRDAERPGRPSRHARGRQGP